MFRSLLQKHSETLAPSNECDLDFRVIERIGGRVYKAIHDSGKFIAVKKIQIPEDGSKENQIKKLEDDVRNLQSLSHPNIIQYLGTRRDGGTLYILMEFWWGTSLFDKFAVLLSENRTRRYTTQLLQGLNYLHERNIIHGNIKRANILLGPSGDIKLADHGLSGHSDILGAQSSSGYRHVIEIFQPPPHLDPSADIWCVGCTMIELTSGKDPWRRESWSNYLLPKKFSSHAKNFLQDCLQWEQQQESSLATSMLLQHPFLNPVFDVRPTQLLPRESLAAEVLLSTSPRPSPNAASAAAKLTLDNYFGISEIEANVEPSTMHKPKSPDQAFGPQHGHGYTNSGTNSESISSGFDSGGTFVSNTSDESKSIPTVVSDVDQSSRCVQKEVYIRKRRFMFRKFLCFWSPY